MGKGSEGKRGGRRGAERGRRGGREGCERAKRGVRRDGGKAVSFVTVERPHSLFKKARQPSNDARPSSSGSPAPFSLLSLAPALLPSPFARCDAAGGDHCPGGTVRQPTYVFLLNGRACPPRPGGRAFTNDGREERWGGAHSGNHVLEAAVPGARHPERRNAPRGRRRRPRPQGHLLLPSPSRRHAGAANDTLTCVHARPCMHRPTTATSFHAPSSWISNPV